MSQAGPFIFGDGLVINTITGNTGVPVVPVAGNINIVTANTTLVFNGVGNTLTLDFGAGTNLLMGSTGFITTGVFNSSFGVDALNIVTSGSSNTAGGGNSLLNLSSGSDNSAYGFDSLRGLTTGSNNISIGSQSGITYNGNESNNILLGSVGVVGENSTIRIGGGQARAFMSGVYGVDVASNEIVTMEFGTQLGTATLRTANTTVPFNIVPGALELSFAYNPNLCLGSSLPNLTTGTQNTSVGNGFNLLTSGSGNTSIGFNAGLSLVDGTSNVCVGASAGQALRGGSHNVLLGDNAGLFYNAFEQNNICIGNNGVAAESNTTRIGNAFTNRAFITGIENVDLATSEMVTVAADQLGSTTLTAGTNIALVAGPGTLTINGTGAGGFTWVVATADGAMAVNTGYISKKIAPGLLTLTLPAVAPIGSVVRVTGYNPGGWRIAQNAAQIIHFGLLDTTVGVGGYLESTLPYDGVEIVCVTANLAWNVISCIGNITVF